MAKVLTERYNVGTMTYLSESKDDASPFLAHFEGIAANYKDPTRNGRLYPRELWDGVLASEDFKEAMETRTCLGELNHPMQDDRLEIDLEKVAIVLLNLEVRNDGNVWARFGVLDTPNGRLLKTLLDSGCQIGVSSRGSGDVVDGSDGPIVEADTYYFVCFDAVVTPAVITARPSMTESVDLDKVRSLTESISEEINNAKTPSELATIQTVLESLNLPEIDSIKESIDIKSNELQSGDDISSGLLADLEESLGVIDQLTTELNELKKSKSANDIRIKRLEELIKKFRASSKDLRAQLLEATATIDSLSSDLVESAAQCESLSNEVESLREQHKVAVADCNKLLESNKHIRTRSACAESIKDELSACKSQLSEAVAEVRSLKRKCEALQNENADLSAKLESSSAAASKIVTERDNARHAFRKTLQSYLRLQASKSGISESIIRSKLPERYTCKDIDRVVESILSYNDRMKKMPIAMTEAFDRKQIVSMQMQSPISEEDATTTSILSNFK